MPPWTLHSAWRQQRKQRSERDLMAELWTSTLWPLIIMVAQSVLLLVVLLIAIAYILLADRKIWAAVQIRRGPNVVGPWGLLQSFADLLKFVLKEPIIPSGAAGELRAGAGGLGRDPDGSRLGDLRHQCRGALYLCDLVAVDLRHHHGRLVVELKRSVPCRPSLGGTDGELRSLDRFCHHYCAALRWFAQSVGRRRSAEHAGARRSDRPAATDVPELVRVAAVSDVRDLLCLGAGGNQPSAVRSGGSRIRHGCGVSGRV